MELRDIHKDSEWYSSYMYAEDGGNDAQKIQLVLE